MTSKETPIETQAPAEISLVVKLEDDVAAYLNAKGFVDTQAINTYVLDLLNRTKHQ